MPEVEIKREYVGKRLDIFLSKKFNDVSRSRWQKKIKAGEILIAGKNRPPHYFLREGDIISMANKQSTVNESNIKIENVQDKNNFIFSNIKVVAENENFIIINKPAGIVVHHDNKHTSHTLVDWLLEHYPQIKGIGEYQERPGIVHRLDKDVSGLMVVALNKKMFEHLRKQFSDRRIAKEYIALVHNAMKQDDGEVKLPIKRSHGKGIFVAVSDFFSVFAKTKSATTKYEVLERFKNYTLLKINILTGRTHQIRVHMRSIGHPIVGDKIYITHDIKKRGRIIDLGRVWLYAAKLGFRDLYGKWQEFELRMPEELREFLDRVGKHTYNDAN
ncbi:RluA family pseudouridine synthase [Candidatus Kuenenbacteria bacterium CG11_big_fil_rev_8_21_14_0_20_37_9]|uniref:Pseudouridine synthase n=2 Tax=Candidatus Kueneniibacteriota TaxID=1752740 RepID=A0A2M6XSH1_9BACT|nr:MAG: hypothetical protein AUJ29_00550 [Candidatus Kuenenbacteria bacterium CG1_02_38_13]PIR05730.1 MAG: RluA family pseudouridine synthase [Candidatus Kuenenbacteria bacterium CG11_big_fil_rev_8_21_14_0_20_37_9]PIU10588.1 MAG: RluA family pseudouridine synthase [Candidatus Kuenenbacteria bacterium CG08_land_8_20_14_0_20_37_23]